MARLNAQASIKFIVGWLAVLLVRLLPFRPPNVEPVLATLMPFAKKSGPLGSFLFSSGSILAFDAVTGKIGYWTLITAATYGLIGLGAWFYFKRFEPGLAAWTSYGVIGTLLYDALTGLTIGPAIFGQSFSEALAGQIPFTVMHLAGTLVLSLALSPLLWRWVADNKKLELSSVIGLAELTV